MRRAVLALALGGCEAATVPYLDPEGGFTLRYPRGLTVEAQKGSAVFAGAGARRHVTVTVDAAPREVKGWSRRRDLALAVEASRTMLRAFPAARWVRDQAATVNGLPARVLEVTFEHEGRAYRRRLSVIESPTQIGYFSLTGPEADFRGGEAAAAAMLATLHLAGVP